MKNVGKPQPPSPFMAGLQPVRPVDEVLGEDARQAVGELEAAPRAGAFFAFQIGLQARVMKIAERGMDAPAQHVAPPGLDHDRIAQHRAGQAIEPGARQFDAQVRRDAMRAGPSRQFAPQPAAHARMGGDEFMRRKRMLRRRRAHERVQRRQQGFEPAGAKDADTLAHGVEFAITHAFSKDIRCGRANNSAEKAAQVDANFAMLH